MRLFTSASDRVFLCAFCVFAALIAACIYYFAQRSAVTLTQQKNDDRYNQFVYAPTDWKFDFALIGTSHAEQWEIISPANHGSLTSPHTIPTVMYFKAKTIIKYHPEVKVVYLEADDHLFFNGQYYTLDGFTPEQKRNSKVFEWNGNFIDGDEEMDAVFGEVAPYATSPLLLLQPDVSPIIIKRIMARMYTGLQPMQLIAPTTPTAAGACDLSTYPSVVDVSQESFWSVRTKQDKNERMVSRIQEHHLDQPGPMKESMLVYYEKTIKLLKAHNIDVVLVLNPEANEFVALKNPEGQKLHQAFVHNMADKYGLRILDFRHLSKHGDRIFSDPDHVADNVSKLLGKAIMQDFCAHALAH